MASVVGCAPHSRHREPESNDDQGEHASLVTPAEARDYRARGWWRDTTIIDDFLDVATRLPEKPAIVSWHVDKPCETLTYRELALWVDRFATGLLALGVSPGDVVSIQLPNWWEFAALHLACARIGAVTNPIGTILRQHEVQFILERTRSKYASSRIASDGSTSP